MIRTFAKDKLIKILQDRPATIRTLQRPDDTFIARCLCANSKVLEYIDKSWLTLPVLQEYIKNMTETSYFRIDNLDAFPLEIRDSLPIGNLRKLCAKHKDAVSKFPNAPHDLWLSLVKATTYLKYNDIPVQHRTEELLIEFFANKNHQNTLPEEAFTDNIVDGALSLKSACINHIPEKFVTYNRVRDALLKSRDLSLNDKIVPETIWDQYLADLASEYPYNIRIIPVKYITKDICKKVVTADYSLLQHIPDSVKDEDIILTAMTHGDLKWNSPHPIPQKMLNKPLLLKLAKKDAEEEGLGRDVKKTFGVENYLHKQEIKPKEWIEVLKICPRALYLIRKENQTDEIINTFFENASLTVIDNLHAQINLARIKKEHAPYLIGSTVKLFQDIITRKMIKKPRKNISKDPIIQQYKANWVHMIAKETVGLDLTDSEYLDITKKFGQ